MAIGNTLLYRQDFTGTTVTVTHNLDLRDVGYRVVCSGQSRSDLVQNMNFTEGDERNSFVINLESYNVGHVQVLGGDIYPANLPSPENNVKLNDLPQASGITDRYVTGATLNSTTLELERNQGLPNVTVDLSSIDTNTFVSGGTFNTTTDNIDFVGNSSDTTFSVDMGIIQHDRQSMDVSGSDITSTSYVDFTNSLTLDTGDLGTNGDYLITFNCYFDNNSDSQNWVIFNISGSTVASTGRMHEIKGKDQKGEDRIITVTHLARNVASGTVIKVQGKTTAGTFGLHIGTLIIDGIRTTNNIS